MQVSQNTALKSNTYSSNQGVEKSSIGIKNLYTQKLSVDEAKSLREQIVLNSNAFTFKSTSTQSNILSLDDKFIKDYEDFQSFLKEIGYEGKSIADLSQEEAKELVSEDGFFGISQTSQRIANFVVSGASGDENLLRAGRSGMLDGFKMAQDLWQDELPEISQQTMQKAIEIVDLKMSDLGFSILDQEV